MSDEKLIELFKSGDFTIIYWDNQVPSVYKGKYTVDSITEDIVANEEIKFDDYESGYCPKIVELLTRALGGKSYSI